MNGSSIDLVRDSRAPMRPPEGRKTKVFGLFLGVGRQPQLLGLIASVGLSTLGCDDKPAPAPSASAAPAAAPSAPPPEPKPWHFGTWSGEYEAKHYLIEMEAKEGAVRTWKADDGGTETGSGKIELSIDEDGSVSGSLSGPLGSMDATGALEGDALSVRLVPTDPEARVTSAFFLADKKGEGFEGTLKASTGDSLVVREAALKLTKSSATLAEPSKPAPPSPEPSAGPSATAPAPSGSAP